MPFKDTTFLVGSRLHRYKHGSVSPCDMTRKLPNNKKQLRDRKRAEGHRTHKMVLEHRKFNRCAKRQITWLKDTIGGYTDQITQQ